MDLSVVICTYNRAESLDQTLLALQRQTVPDSIRWEIVVVDNNSSDSTRTIVERFGLIAQVPVRYVFEPTQGHSHARNTGISAAKGEIIAFTDDDVTPEADWVRSILHALDAGNADGVGGRILPTWEFAPPPWLAGERHLLSTLALLESRQAGVLGARDATLDGEMRVWGANMAFRRSVVDRIGSFDPELGIRGDTYIAGEDLDFVTRAVIAGNKIVYDPRIVVWHRIGRERMVRSFFRKRARDRGRHDGVNAPIRLGRHLLGLSPYRLRSTVGHAVAWAASVLSRDREAFCRELGLWYQMSYIITRAKSSLSNGRYLGLSKKGS